MYARFRHLDGACAGHVRVVRQDFATIGRHPSSDVQFDPDRDLDVSGRHAAVFRQGEGWVLRDLDSTNGTFVNGARVRGDHPLAPDDVIRFGSGGPQLAFTVGEGVPTEMPATRVVLPFERAEAPTPPPRPVTSRLVAIPTEGRTTQRIRVEVRRRTEAWRRVALGAAVVALVAIVGTTVIATQRTRSLERQRSELLARADSLLRRLQATTSTVGSLDQALQAARGETERLRASLVEGGAATRRLADLSREIGTTLDRHQAVLRAAQLDAAAITERSGDAVALLVAQYPDGGGATGSGFAVRARNDTGWVVTSRHLVLDAAGRPALRLGVMFNGSAQNFRADLVATDSVADLALVRVRVRGGVPTVPGVAGRTGPGEAAAVVGFPLGLEVPGMNWRRYGVRASTFAGSVTRVTDDVLELDGYGASGSSGSPVFDAGGLVMGVVSGGDPQRAGRVLYAVPFGRLAAFLAAQGLR